MNRTELDCLLIEFSRLVLERVNEDLINASSDTILREDLRIVLKKKLQFPYETRLHVLYLLNNILGGSISQQEMVSVGKIYELMLLAMYHGNMLLDGKGGLEVNFNNLLITTVLLQNYAFMLIQEFTGSQYKDFLYDELLRVSTVFHKGQYSDVNSNLFTGMNFQWSKKEYWMKIYRINAFMYESISRVVAIMNSNHVLTEQVIKFGRFYGYIIQLVNDIIDFIPSPWQQGTAEKVPDDAYADIRNRHVTLPFYYFWQTLDIDERRGFIERFDALVDPRNEELARWMIRTGAIKRAQEDVRNIARKCRLLMKQFPQEYHEPLNEMLVIAYSNRFYKALKKLEKGYCT